MDPFKNIVSSRGQNGHSYKITGQKPEGFGFRWTAEYGHGFSYEGQLIIDTDPRGNLKWEPHRETPCYRSGWPENTEELQATLTDELKRRLNGGWKR